MDFWNDSSLENVIVKTKFGRSPTTTNSLPQPDMGECDLKDLTAILLLSLNYEYL